MNISAKRREVTIKELRLLGSALIDFEYDFPGELPIARTPVPTDFIKSALVPDYLISAPRVDGWGATVLYWSDGDVFAVMSPGSDGKFGESVLSIEETVDSESLEAELCRGEFEFEGTDLIWWFDNMCQWSAGEVF